ncbi:MAG: AAA family ATPase [Gammaproteobacteria bacterium]|nr:AAA family ATPase [Gammaproteobacteria bacterium]
MNNNLIAGHIRFEQMIGVGTVDVNFAKDKNAYVLIGENGVGKTKFLESLFATLLITNHYVRTLTTLEADYPPVFPFGQFIINGNSSVITKPTKKGTYGYIGYSWDNINLPIKHNFPIVYIATSNRETVYGRDDCMNELGNKNYRRTSYIKHLMSCFEGEDNRLKHLNMMVNLDRWIIQRAQSTNKFQAQEDNREVEITTLLEVLNKIDSRIDNEFLEVSGDNRVFIKIENQKRELSELSSGFTSILKILQAIIAGYSYFTNETQIQNVRGFVLIDEIESHLHNEWQVKIVPLLKEIFPNTTFVITTHSSLVISQLEQGEAYRLQRESDGIVYGRKIQNPNKITFIDLMQNAFGIDLNKLKIDRAKKSHNKDSKAAILALIDKELARLENKL